MHNLEPFYAWRHLYNASEDEKSPFYEREYSETECTYSVYNYYIHPQWDEMGSATLYVKILFADYHQHYCIIELLGEWNDLLYNDIMFLKRNVVEAMLNKGINRFILIGENVLNFHADDDSYYQEWFDDLEDGWIAFINFREHVLAEIQREGSIIIWQSGGKLNEISWRTLNPAQLFSVVDSLMNKRLNA